MAWTARSEEEKREYFDSPEELEKKISQLAEWVRESKHMIVFTVSSYHRIGRDIIVLVVKCGYSAIHREQASALRLAVSDRYQMSL